MNLSGGQRLVLGVLHVLPVGRHLQLFLRLCVADIPELEVALVVALQEVHLLGVEGYGLEMQGQLGNAAFRHPEERVRL